ncbi:MAG: hypothetical protein PHD97_07250 [Bacteroidales bacterium]|nr:hypothetical protein [Bacteroidales bacterium]
MNAILDNITLPEFGMPTVEPKISSEIYNKRIEKTLKCLEKRNIDVLVVYADREHMANLSYLVGYDPRFEEALLILRKGSKPALLIGNEGWGFADLCPVEVKKVLFQSMSLLGQSRQESKMLKDIFMSEGISKGKKVGIAGWKYFSNQETPSPEQWIESPSYIADTLREITGNNNNVVNVTDIFMNPADGLRIINEVDQLAAFEFASCYSSQGLRNVIFGLKTGMTEYEASRLMGSCGIPLSCHQMLSTGKRAEYGLPSPSMKRIEKGETFTMAFGLWGALNARAGFVVHDEKELPEGIRDYVDKLVIPYYTAIAEWYEHIGIGVKGGELYDIIHNRLNDKFFGVGLNPGHYIHLDEWVHSPVFKGSEIVLKTGMAMQADVIPATGTEYYTTNIEDGLALCDETMRKEFENKYPDAWKRIQKRRQFVMETLGIRLKPEVLLFSNIPAYLTPYLLSPTKALKIVR